MTKTTLFTVQVQFGDCDPAGIVFFPNFSRWMDAASHHFFIECGVTRWDSMPDLPGCVGAPLLEIHTRFHESVTYCETIEVHTDIEEWRAKVFVQRHRVMRGDTLICDGRETRALCVRSAEGQLKAVPVPEWIRSLCE